MKTWIKNNSHLLALYEGVQKYSTKTTTRQQKTTARSAQQTDSEAAKTEAAKKIQHMWRGYKIKKSFAKDPYGSYLSMISQDDEQRLLSSIMFGRHEAELRKDAPDRIANPYIHNSAFYHRVDNLAGTLLDQINKEFKISPEMLAGKIMVPVTELKTVPIEGFIKKLGVAGVKIMKDPSRSIAIVLIPKGNSHVRRSLISAGLIASPWEIAQNISPHALADHKSHDKTRSIPPAKTKKKLDEAIYMNGLPETKDALLHSDLFNKLRKIAHNKERPTQQLAASLIQLIESDDVLTPAAVKRIALIIDMANTFYANNYPRFAFCVYAILHELSLSLALKTKPEQLATAFNRFLSESKESLTKSLGLQDADLTNSTFIASPALSGTNAFTIAKNIAAMMKVKPGKTPTIKMYKPCYYELDTNEFSQPGFSDPDIFLFSSGPIVNLDGLTPGVDINRFVHEKVIKTGRSKPTTLIIDATTTLYKNLHLDEDVKKLVKDGKLSIIVFESHQKFGLLHSDQAQYGRMFSLCAKGMYDEEKLQKIQHDAELDFNQHLDMRVGANINHCCKDTLEQIKQQHFSNGALFKNILTQANLISTHLVHHKYMSKNLEELYFVVPDYPYSWEYFGRLIPFRNSFGHYSTTLSFVGHLGRLCANASDNTDALIISSRIYLALSHRGQEKVILENSRELDGISASEQIISLAMTQNMISPQLNVQPTSITGQITWYCALNNILNACQSLKGRDSYEEVQQYFNKLQKKIITEAGVFGVNPNYLNAVHIAYNAKLNLPEERLNNFKLNASLCNFLVFVARTTPSLRLSNDLISHLIAQPKTLTRIIEHQDFFVKHKDLFKKIGSLGIYLDAQSLESLLTNEQTLTVLNRLLEQGISLNSNNIKMISNRELVAFIANHQSLSVESLSVLAMLSESGIAIDKVTMNLAKENAQFRKLIALVYNTNATVLTHLQEKEGGNKYKASLNYTPTYLKESFSAIKTFCTQTPAVNEQLIKSISLANKKYCDTVLSKDRSTATRVAKAMFKGLILALVAVLSLLNPVALRETYKFRLFKTESEKKLQNIEPQLNESLSSPKEPRSK